MTDSGAPLTATRTPELPECMVAIRLLSGSKAIS
jgi:hypothetical protein